MPKHKETFENKVMKWLTSVSNKEAYKISDAKLQKLFCKACVKQFVCTRISHLEQHENSSDHKILVKKPLRQTLFTDSNSDTKNSEFYYEMCHALVAANIDWNKLTCQPFVKFLERYCGRRIPEESTLRKNYLYKCYNDTINKIRNEIGESSIWLSADETTDKLGRNIANIIVGKMSSSVARTPLLLASKQLDRTNNVTVTRFINESLGLLWPSGIKYERVALMVTDGVPYMVKTGVNLKIFYPNLLHLTCLAHALNLVCEVIRSKYDNVNGLISNVKKVFLKAPLRVEVYKEALPDVPLPPQPVLVRWGTWLEAAFFYATHYDKMKKVVMAFDPQGSQAIEKSQSYFKESTVKNELLYIKSHFEILVESIKKLETIGLPLTESIEVIENVEKSLKNSPGLVAKLAYNKLVEVLKKNPGYEDLVNIKKFIEGDSTININISDFSIFKFAPITSCDSERSFSWLKGILTDKRSSFTVSNLEQYLVTYANAKIGVNG